jgi:hypothetical protein
MEELFRAGLDLMYSTADRLFAGDDPEQEEWRRLATAYEAMTSDPQWQVGAELPPSMRALGQLARTVVAPSLRDAAEIADQIPEIPPPFPGSGLPRELAAAVVANRRVQTESGFTKPSSLRRWLCRIWPARASFQGRASPSAAFELAMSLYPLLSVTQSQGDVIAPRLCRIAETCHGALEGFTRRGDQAGAVSAAGMFVAIANTLATRYGVADHMRDAMTCGERVLSANPRADAQDAGGLITLASNLMTTYMWCAERKPATAKECYEKQVAAGLYASNAIYASEPDVGKELIRVGLYEICIRKLVEARARLAGISRDQFDAHASAACHHLQQAHDFIARSPDPDLQLRMDNFRRDIYDRLRTIQPGWVPPTNVDETPAAAPNSDAIMQHLEEHIERQRERASASAIRIQSLNDFAEQRAAIQDSFRVWYSELAPSLGIVLLEVGLNHHVCKVLLALGALASGRLGAVAPSPGFFLHWMFRVPDANEHPTGFRLTVQAHQRHPATQHLAEETNLIATVIGIATLAGSLQTSPPLSLVTQSVLRDHTAALLSEVLPHTAHVEYNQSKKRAPYEDLVDLLHGFPADCQLALLNAYDRTGPHPGSAT